MKYSHSFHVLILSLILASASLTPLFAAESPYMTTAPVSFYADQGTVAPVIDGFIDGSEWQYSPQSSSPTSSFWSIQWDLTYEGLGEQTGVVDSIQPDDVPFDTNDCSCTVYTIYDDEYFYIAVRVLDDVVAYNDAAPDSEDEATWNDDSVEIFIDGDHSKFDQSLTGASSADQDREFATGGQFVISCVNARRDNEAGNPSFGQDADWYGIAEITDTGYEVEMKIKLSKIGNPQKGSTVGFNVAINDDDDDADPRYQLRWTGLAHVESTYGTLYFGPRTLTAPLVDGPVAIDGVMDEGDWAKAAVENITPIEGVLIEDIMPALEGDIAYTAHIMHDETWLYVAVIVEDNAVIHDTEPEGSHNANTWHDDSIEVFIDQDLSHGSNGSNNRYDSAEYIEGQFVLTAGNATRDSNTQNSPLIGEDDGSDWWAWATENDNGWVGEMRFKKETLVGFEQVGFNLAVNDDDPEGSEPDYQLRWQGTPHVESSYGLLILGGPATKVSNWMIH